MRAFIVPKLGPPEVMQLGEVAKPVPGEHDLLVEVHATSVNPVDTKIRVGTRPRTPPLVLGYDVSGVVTGMGTQVKGFGIGDEVYGSPNIFGFGANAEYVLLDARASAHKPETLDHVHAACLPLVSLTAYEALHERAHIQPAQTVLIHAGAGGVGHIAVQLAKLHGCKVITTAGREESIAFCRDNLKADVVINYHKEDFAARIKELTADQGVPVVFDTVGGDTFRKSIDCLPPLGQLVTITASDPGAAAPTLLYKGITVHYEFMGVRVAYQREPEKQRAILSAIARLVDNGHLKVHVSKVWKFDELVEAHRAIETGRTIGKMAVQVK